MASHHQPYHPFHHPPPTPATSATATTTTTTTNTTCYCYCYYSGFPPYHHHPLPPDPHLPYVAHPPQPHSFSSHTPHAHRYHPPQSYSHLQNHQYFPEPTHHQHQCYHKEELTPPLVTSSLLRRISALEAALKRHSSSSAAASLYSLRDAAARTIQKHFRSFLIRRSRTLGQLKELAAIKSAVNALKSSVSENTHLDFQGISFEAMDLLLKLDSIQGGDPMIRDGKRSISRELDRLVEFSDRISVKRKDYSSRIVKSVRCGGDNNNSRDFRISKKTANIEAVKVGKRVEEIERLRERIERINGLSRDLEEDGEEDEALESPVVSLVRKSGVSNTEGRGNVIEKLRGPAERNYELCRVTEDDDEEYDEELEAPAVSLVAKNRVSVAKSGGLMKGRAAQAKVKRSVTFVEDQNVYRVLGRNHDLVMNGVDSDHVHGSNSIDEPQIVRHLVRKGEEIGRVCKETGTEDEEYETEEEGSPQSADAEKGANNTLKNKVVGESHDHDEDGDFVFSAPVPAKMESRADLLNNRKSLKMENL